MNLILEISSTISQLIFISVLKIFTLKLDIIYPACEFNIPQKWVEVSTTRLPTRYPESLQEYISTQCSPT